MLNDNCCDAISSIHYIKSHSLKKKRNTVFPDNRREMKEIKASGNLLSLFEVI